MCAFELFGQHLQRRIPDSERLKFFHRSQHVIATGTRAAVALTGVMQLFGQAELAGVLAVPAIDNIAKRVHAFLRIVVKPDPAPRLAVDPSDLFAGTQIFDGFQAPAGGNPIGDASTIPSPVEAEYQPRLLRRSSVDERINAKRAMGAHQASVSPLQKIEARPPH